MLVAVGRGPDQTLSLAPCRIPPLEGVKSQPEVGQSAVVTRQRSAPLSRVHPKLQAAALLVLREPGSSSSPDSSLHQHRHTPQAPSEQWGEAETTPLRRRSREGEGVFWFSIVSACALGT